MKKTTLLPLLVSLLLPLCTSQRADARRVAVAAAITKTGCDAGGSDCIIVIDIDDSNPGPFPDAGGPNPDWAVVWRLTGPETTISPDFYVRDCEADTNGASWGAYLTPVWTAYSKLHRNILSDFQYTYPSIEVYGQ